MSFKDLDSSSTAVLKNAEFQVKNENSFLYLAFEGKLDPEL